MFENYLVHIQQKEGDDEYYEKCKKLFNCVSVTVQGKNILKTGRFFIVLCYHNLVSIYVSLFVAVLSTTVSMLFTLKNHRRNVLSSYAGTNRSHAVLPATLAPTIAVVSKYFYL